MFYITTKTSTDYINNKCICFFPPEVTLYFVLGSAGTFYVKHCYKWRHSNLGFLALQVNMCGYGSGPAAPLSSWTAGNPKRHVSTCNKVLYVVYICTTVYNACKILASFFFRKEGSILHLDLSYHIYSGKRIFL